MIIDAHQHFWSIDRDDYGWLTPDAGMLYRDFGPDDLTPLLNRTGVEKTVLVQAAPNVTETEFMLDIADTHDFVAKVVGWIDFEDRDDLKQLERFAGHAKFAGVRPMIQDIPDPDWMHRMDVAWAYDAIMDMDLTFDALGFPVHLDPFLRLFSNYPGMRVVVDHCMKPQIRDGAFDGWAEDIERIADETGAFCKLSGLVTEANPDWDDEALRPYVEHVIDVFGPDRVMWGSDWPVATLAAEYETWHDAATGLIEDSAARDKIFGDTAARFYRIES